MDRMMGEMGLTENDWRERERQRGRERERQRNKICERR
jgi:hypothetical protein